MNVMATDVMRERMSAYWGLLFIEGIALLLVGVALITQPAASIAVLVTFLGAYWLISGVLSFMRLFVRAGRAHWAWNTIFGVLGVFAGLVVLRHPFWSALIVPEVLVIVLGVNAMILGVTALVRAFSGDGMAAGVLGVLNILIGAALFVAPISFASFILGMFALVGGATLMFMAWSLRSGRMLATEVVTEEETLRRAA